MSRVSRKYGGLIVKAGFEGLAALANLHPKARPEAHKVERIRDISYGPEPEHVLDIWRPVEPGPHPCVLYIHGGGFSILSKDTHWIMALMFARRGYTVFNINYRLAPRHAFPAAVHDACRAWLWMLEHGERYGASIETTVIAGESAGANLATSVAFATSHPFEHEAWAMRVHQAGVKPSAVAAACGIFQVSAPERLWRDKPHFPGWLKDRLMEINRSYLAGQREGLSLADPVCWLEEHAQPLDLPPFFLPVGTKDPLLADTRRLAKALKAHGGAGQDAYYPEEVHAFHAFIWREEARRCWRETFEFLGEHAPGSRMS